MSGGGKVRGRSSRRGITRPARNGHEVASEGTCPEARVEEGWGYRLRSRSGHLWPAEGSLDRARGEVP